MSTHPLDSIYYDVLGQLDSINNDNLPDFIKKLLGYLADSKKKLEKMEISFEVTNLFIYVLAAFSDRFILTNCTNSFQSASTRQVIANSLEVQIFGTAIAGTQLIKNIKSVSETGDRNLARIYIEILGVDIFHNAYAQYITHLRSKFNLHYTSSADPFRCIINLNNNRQTLFDYLQYRFALAAAIAGYIVISSCVWFYATH